VARVAGMGQVSGFISLWASAVATFEGFYTAGSRPARDNNPGDLKYAGQPGATGQDSLGFAVFPTADAGWTALDNQLQAYVNQFPDYDIFQIMEHYLGQNITAEGGEVTSQGNSTTYANYVASAIGVDPNTTLSDLAAGGAPAPAGDTVASAIAPADPAAPVDEASIAGVPSTNGMLVLMIGGALMFWVLGRVFGWMD